MACVRALMDSPDEQLKVELYVRLVMPLLKLYLAEPDLLDSEEFGIPL